jgi:2-amino-4-hydroxy-6-hydroxymethyldihydropteridine diphosphokinase
MQPLALLAHLRALERRAGRERRERWGARTLDLDILDYNGVVLNDHAGQSTDAELVLPHPSMHEREFVLAPIAEIAPRWRHPVLRKTARQLLAGLDDSQGGNIISSEMEIRDAGAVLRNAAEAGSHGPLFPPRGHAQARA